MRFIRTRLVQLLIDASMITVALALAYVIRFDGWPPGFYRKQFILVVPYLVLLRLAIFGAFGVYKLIWRYVTVRDLPRLIGATVLGSVVVVAARFVVGPAAAAAELVVNPAQATVPWSVVLTEFVLTTGATLGVRALWRLTTEEVKRKRSIEGPTPTLTRALLIGAGSAGVMVAREAKSNRALGFQIVGFLDDNPDKQNTIIHGFQVLGKTDQLAAISKKLNAELAIITIGDASANSIRTIVELADKASMKVQTIPNLDEILTGRVAISKLRDVDIEDLLRRESVQLDHGEIERFLTGKKVFVTGAGGSIGSEICRQVSRFLPQTLTLFDQAETSMFHIHRELLDQYPDADLVPLIGNVTDRERVREALEIAQPDVVFHAAAFKHVPLMEANPGEAIRNNVGGSRVVADMAHETGVDAFVMISTDKAVNPSSVMGATKRLAEIYIQSLAQQSNTRFMTVRFGNVLGSAGSVVPIFKEEISKGGPVHVTHPDMKRYFMSIPEASQLVLQASAMGKGGEILVLEMGEPIRIVDLARDLIRLSGYQPDREIEIVFSGIRPGEKLSEEINLSEENSTKTRHPRIWIGESVVRDLQQTAAAIDQLIEATAHQAPANLRRQLERVVPKYTAWIEDDEPTPLRRPASSKSRLTSGSGSSEATLPSSA
jgi:FlaA1/EpsC-like NDP-sugar epimerase